MERRGDPELSGRRSLLPMGWRAQGKRWCDRSPGSGSAVGLCRADAAASIRNAHPRQKGREGRNALAAPFLPPSTLPQVPAVVQTPLT